jgi:two-component system, OmpR family, sensor histidine kinase KdpD
VESLSHEVAKITHIRVRETVPDTILDRAGDIELVDLTPAELICRLREGKVYVPKQADRALRHYFSPGKLAALRELALRRAGKVVTPPGSKGLFARVSRYLSKGATLRGR